MKNLNRLNDLRVVRPVRLATSAAALAASLVAAAGISVDQANAAPLLRAGKASHLSRAAEFKRPKLAYGLLSIEGTDASDRITLRRQAGNPDVLEVDVGDDGTADFSFKREKIAMITVDARAGDDAVRIDDGNGAFTDAIPTTIDGGDGNDTIAGGKGAETLIGGNGNDSIDGNGGNDLALLGAGDDTFTWDPGDGSDRVEGQDGTDEMVFNGAAVAEQVDLSANGNRLRFFRTQGNITMDTAGIEVVDFNALGGADLVTVNDLTGTDVSAVNVDLAATLGGATGDGQADRVVVNGTDGNDAITVNGDSGGVKVSGLTAGVKIVHAESANDRLEINTLAGRDSVDSSGLAAGALQLFVNGVLVP